MRVNAGKTTASTAMVANFVCIRKAAGFASQKPADLKLHYFKTGCMPLDKSL